MTVASETSEIDAVLEVPLAVGPELQFEIEQFLFFEATLLDARRYRDWLHLLAHEVSYFMPTRNNRTSRELEHENSKPGQIAFFDDDKRTMEWRVNQLETGMHWAEDPPSRTRHLVTNVQIEPAEVDGEYNVESNFFCDRNRLDTEVDLWVGVQQDLLRNVGTP